MEQQRYKNSVDSIPNREKLNYFMKAQLVYVHNEMEQNGTNSITDNYYNVLLS